MTTYDNLHHSELIAACLASITGSVPGAKEHYFKLLDTIPQRERELLYRVLGQYPEQFDINNVINDANGGAPDILTIPLISADTILATEYPEPVWAVRGYLPVGLSLLGGAPKLGKSWFALQLAFSIGAGGKFLDQDVDTGSVLYCALEDSPRRLHERMHAMNWISGLPVDFVTLGTFDTIGDLLKGGAEKLAHIIEQRTYRLVVIDTFSRAIQGDQSEVGDMTRALIPLQETAHFTNSVILLIDHHRKASGFLPDAVQDVLGSTAKGAMVDTALGLYRERGKSAAKLQITGRDVEERTIEIDFDRQTMSWQFIGDVNELAMTERRQEILEALQGLGRATCKQIATEINQPKSNTYTRLQDLVSSGLVLRDGFNYELSNRD